MKAYKTILLLGLLFVLALTVPCWARMVSISKNDVNMRSGPGTNYRVKWVLGQGYPLHVVATRGKWLKVRDFENTTGWVYKPLVNRRPHMVVKKKLVNVRSRPSLHAKVVARAKYGVVFRTLKRGKNWVKVRHQNGITGWVARRLVWGW